MKSFTPSSFSKIRSIPLWVYPAVLIIIIFVLSLTPGGDDLKLLIVPVLGWATSIWLFRNYNAVRKFVYISFTIIVLLALAIIVLSDGMRKLTAQ